MKKMILMLLFSTLALAKNEGKTIGDVYPLEGTVYHKIVPVEHPHQYTVEVGRDVVPGGLSIGCTAGDSGVFCSQESGRDIKYLTLQGKDYGWEWHGRGNCNHLWTLLLDMTFNEQFAGGERKFFYRQGKKADEILVPCISEEDKNGKVHIIGESRIKLIPCGENGEHCLF